MLMKTWLNGTLTWNLLIQQREFRAHSSARWLPPTRRTGILHDHLTVSIWTPGFANTNPKQVILHSSDNNLIYSTLSEFHFCNDSSRVYLLNTYIPKINWNIVLWEKPGPTSVTSTSNIIEKKHVWYHLSFCWFTYYLLECCHSKVSWLNKHTLE